jgi:mono/diheme cytochrome c family protein/plastocyanin
MVVGRMNQERLARLSVLVLALSAGLAALGFRFWGNTGVVEVHAAMPDQGGWLTSNINAQVGEPLHLRLVSDDVVHSFALGQSNFEPVDVMPGKPTDVTLTFDQPGTYTFYCTRWCGADHWRMRGTITVTGDDPVNTNPPDPPLYLQLGIDLDSVHELHNQNLEGQPSAERGAALDVTLPPEFLILEYYRSHSPEQTWDDLNTAPFTADLGDSQIWNLVALVWQQNTDSAKLTEGGALYQRDCAACHGVAGGGDGIFRVEENAGLSSPHETSPDGHSVEMPTNFQDQNHMLSASSALLQGKILRGGMGTGMPSWGLIYTEEQTWALVDYLWTFIFNYSLEE